MSCEDCPPEKATVAPKPEPTSGDNHSLARRILHLFTNYLPEGSALISCSCCWLPTVLDFLFAGSVTAAGVESLRNALLAISIAGLSWGILREGFTRRIVLRIMICAGLLIWAHYNRQAREVQKVGSHSCH